jgi:RNA polymerase sigma-70 factor, ECF subfamily
LIAINEGEGRGHAVNLTDQQIASRAADGEVAAYVLLVERYRAPLIGYIFGLTARREEAEELAQETFFRVWEKLPTLRQHGSLVSWLYRIAHNLAVSAMRRPRLARLQHDPARLDTASREDAFLAVHRAVAELPEPQRVVVSLKHFSGLSQEQIADVLVIPAGTVRSRLSRAYESLRPVLAHLLEA